MQTIGSTIRRVPSVKPDLTLAVLVTAFVFLCALAWGSPFVVPASGAVVAQVTQTQAEPGQVQSATFTGTVVRNGEQFMLRDSSGQVYRLDNTQHVQPFEGKSVKVTGKLDAEARLIHVEHIESAMA